MSNMAHIRYDCQHDSNRPPPLKAPVFDAWGRKQNSNNLIPTGNVLSYSDCQRTSYQPRSTGWKSSNPDKLIMLIFDLPGLYHTFCFARRLEHAGAEEKAL
jgi:hypothetical protein